MIHTTTNFSVVGRLSSICPGSTPPHIFASARTVAIGVKTVPPPNGWLHSTQNSASSGFGAIQDRHGFMRLSETRSTLELSLFSNVVSYSNLRFKSFYCVSLAFTIDFLFAQYLL